MTLPRVIFGRFLGARILKTGLAVFIALAIFHWFGSGYATFAAVAAILAVQPSSVRAWQAFAQQLLGNIIGGAVGVLLGLWLGPTPFAMALASIIVLAVCTRLKLNEAASLAVVVVLFVMDRPGQDFLIFAAARVATIIGGMLIGAVVNRYLFPPNFLSHLKAELGTASDGVDAFGQHLLKSLPSPEHYLKEAIKGEAATIQGHLDSARYYLDLLQEADPVHSALLPHQKVKASLYVFTERIMDIHKIVLQLRGLAAGPELTRVTTALEAVFNLQQEVVGAALAGRSTGMKAHAVCADAITALQQLAEGMVADPETRVRGLGLHGIETNIRHMYWRMQSLTRLIQEGEMVRVPNR